MVCVFCTFGLLLLFLAYHFYQISRTPGRTLKLLHMALEVSHGSKHTQDTEDTK